MAIDEQLIPQVAQLKAEREVCVAHGNSDRVAAIDRQLAAFGAVDDEPEQPAKRATSSSPQGRSAPQARQTKAAK